MNPYRQDDLKAMLSATGRLLTSDTLGLSPFQPGGDKSAPLYVLAGKLYEVRERVIEHGDYHDWRRRQRTMSPFSLACDTVCGFLPEGWTLVIDLEQGAGCVRLEDPQGDDIGIHSDSGLEDALYKALFYAQEHEEKYAARSQLG